MFAKPRPKKLLLSHPSKKRKFTSAVEEVTFDNAARHEYLTGFHKRKQERIKRAQEEAARRQRLEKIETRKQVIGTYDLPVCRVACSKANSRITGTRGAEKGSRRSCQHGE
jgi:hypothetical protein